MAYPKNHSANAKRQAESEAVKVKVIEHLGSGIPVKRTLAMVQRTQKWYEWARKADPVFKEACDAARAAHRESVEEADKVIQAQRLAMGQSRLGPFEEWSEQYLKLRVWPHHENMIDVVHGREPRNLHPSMIYEPGSAGARRILINVPPNHAKTMLLSIGYVTYKIIENPNINVLIVSKTQDMAKKILYAVKQRLTHPRWKTLQDRFAPLEGFRATSDTWSATKIYLGGEARDSDQKDPTIEAVGIGGMIYGARANLIVLDDVVTLSNANEYEKQDSWIRQEVASRIGPGGQIVVVGTRVAPLDLYRYLRDPETYTDNQVPWTYLAMPAVLEYGHGVDEWETLWPISDEPFVDDDDPMGSDSKGLLYPRWTGPRLSDVRNETGPRKWSLVYQQADIADDAVFDALCVRGSCDTNRRVGPLKDRTGWHVLAGLDPAVAGTTAAVVYAVNREDGSRMVLDVQTLTSPTPLQIRGLIESLTDTYSPNEWIIETNAFQGFLANDETLRAFLANRGIVLKPHYTGNNKTDPDFGVASMSGLFGTRTTGEPGKPSHHQGDNLLSLPAASTQGMKVLTEELVSWNPELPVKRRKQDTVMALWFCELRAREIVTSSRRGSHFLGNNPFLSERDKARRVVIDLNEWAAAQNAM